MGEREIDQWYYAGHASAIREVARLLVSRAGEAFAGRRDHDAHLLRNTADDLESRAKHYDEVSARAKADYEAELKEPSHAD